MSKWFNTRFPGVRYRKHPNRKHGVNFDRYFAIRYQRDGVRREEGLGWASEKWTVEKAALKLAELKEAYTTGEGAARLADQRELKREKDREEEREKARLDKENVTFGRFFEETYWPLARTDKKPGSYNAERIYFNKWIDPVIGQMAFKNIRPLNILRIRKNMTDAGKSPRTTEYVLAIVRQVWNLARGSGVANSQSPTREVSKIKFDNKRLRFLSHEEADALLAETRERSSQLHDMSLLSLHCGLRAEEIFSLKWGKVDIDRGIVTVDGKGDKSRPAFMTAAVKDMLESREGGGRETLVFVDRNGKKIRRISGAFQRSVDGVALNEGVTDRRLKVVFHTLRHTFASWLAENGTDLYVIQKLMGHSTIAMTERYAHLRQGTLQTAVRSFERKISASKTGKVVEL